MASSKLWDVFYDNGILVNIEPIEADDEDSALASAVRQYHADPDDIYVVAAYRSRKEK